MAASRARPRKPDPLEALLLEAVGSALQRAQQRIEALDPRSEEPLRRRPARRPPLTAVVGYSGGRDSTVLLHVMARLAAQRGSGLHEVVAVHVHHGISRHADDWLFHCEREAAALGVRFVGRRVSVKRAGRGLEAAARESRYEALADVAAEEGARIVCCAHHRDDRLETFLMQWMRGAGLEGLAAFAPARAFASGEVALVRPFIDVTRAELERFVDERHLAFVEDDSNDDRTLLRNALRLDVLPRLDELRAGFRAAAARSVDLVAEAAEALRSVAEGDLALCQDGAPAGMLRLDALALLPPGSPDLGAARLARLARHRGRVTRATAGDARPGPILRAAMRACSCAWASAKFGAIGACCCSRPATRRTRDTESFRWNGEDEVCLPAWGGVLRFARVADEEGFDPDWLAQQPLEVKPRSGGERFKPHAGRPSKTLKRLYQDAGIAEFDRGRLPLRLAGRRPDLRSRPGSRCSTDRS